MIGSSVLMSVVQNTFLPLLEFVASLKPLRDIEMLVGS